MLRLWEMKQRKKIMMMLTNVINTAYKQICLFAMNVLAAKHVSKLG